MSLSCGHASYKECTLERRWHPVGFGGYFGDFCKDAPIAHNPAWPSGKIA